MPYLRSKNTLPLIPGYASGDLATINDACSGAPINHMMVGIIDPNGITGCTVACNGINQWDEEWESGYIGTDGSLVPSDSFIRSKNLIPIEGGATYYFYKRNDSQGRICYYDKSGNYTGRSDTNLITNKPFTTPNDCSYIKFYVSVPAYTNDISINYPSTDTDYHTFVGAHYDLDWSSELGSVTYGSFVIDKSGTVTVNSGGTHTPIADTAPLKTHSGVNYIICTAGTIQNITYIRRLDS